MNAYCYRPVIEFSTLESVEPQQIHKRMTVVYGEDAPSHATTMSWAAQLCRGRRSLQDDSSFV